MKNTKITKIALLVLSVALLIGTAVGFSVSAEETAAEYEILAKNVIYGDKTAVAVAVNATIDEANNETVKVAYYWAEDGKASWTKATLLDTTVANNLYNDETHKDKPVFAAAGVAAKNLGDVLYLTTYTGDAPADNANWISYSPAEYFYSKLYKDDFINKTEADDLDYNRRLMYEAQLKLSANAQVVLNYKADQLVSDCTMAYTNVSDITINGGEYAFDPSGKINSVTLGYTGSEEYTGYKVGEFIYSKAKAEAGKATFDGVCEVTLYTDPIPEYIYDFEDTLTDGFVFNTYATTSSKVEILQTSISTEAPANVYGTTGRLIVDSANEANKVLRWAVNNGVTSGAGSGTTQSADGAGKSVLKFNAREMEEGGTIHILEMDFNLVSSAKAKSNSFSEPFSLKAYDADGNEVGNFYRTNGSSNTYNGFFYIDQNTYKYADSAYTLDDSNANVYHFFNHSGRTGSRTDANGLVMFDRNEWYRFRFVWNTADNSIGVEFSIDNGENWYLACAYQTADAVTGDIAYLGFETSVFYNVGLEILIDNVDYTIVSEYTRATVDGKNHDGD